jgi:hypothetical protein
VVAVGDELDEAGDPGFRPFETPAPLGYLGVPLARPTPKPLGDALPGISDPGG